MKRLEHYIDAAKQHAEGFSHEDFKNVVESAPSAPSFPFSSTTIFHKIMIPTISLSALGLCTALWMWLSPKPSASLPNTSQSSNAPVQVNTTSTAMQQPEVPMQATPLLAQNTPPGGGERIQQAEKQPAIAGIRGVVAKRSIAPSKSGANTEGYNTDEGHDASAFSQQSTIKLLSTFKLPKSLSFCDELVPLEDIEVRERVDREFMASLQQSGRIVMYLKRAKRWFPLIERILKEEKMHDDLKYLCVAESELAQARSPMGAVGFWQFIESTAREYGLQVDDYVDERKNIEKSTRAACTYFRNAKRKLPSWTLCAAGYNQGINGTARDVDFQETTNYFDLYLNEETSRYVIRIAVIKHIMENASRYGFNINYDGMYNQYNTESVTLTTAVSNLQDWAKERHCTYKYLKLLNPWLKKNELPAPTPGTSWTLLLPKYN